MFPRMFLTVVMLLAGIAVLLMAGTRRNIVFVVIGLALYMGALLSITWQMWRAGKRKRKSIDD